MTGKVTVVGKHPGAAFAKLLSCGVCKLGLPAFQLVSRPGLGHPPRPDAWAHRSSGRPAGQRRFPRIQWREIARPFASLYEELLASSPRQQVERGRRA
jgi:hypothetical protein